jgi:hypothetical protein
MGARQAGALAEGMRRCFDWKGSVGSWNEVPPRAERDCSDVVRPLRELRTRRMQPVAGEFGSAVVVADPEH